MYQRKGKICSIRAKPQFSTHTHTHTHTGSFCLAFFSIIFAFSNTVFASGIPATDGVADPATCDTDTLETSTGPVQLRAQFTPEEINLRWYNNNTLLNVTSASNTCTYDTAINLPTNPNRPGYKFKGWKIRPEYDFSTLPRANSTQQTTDRYLYTDYKKLTNNEYVCMQRESVTPDIRTIIDCPYLDNAEWRVGFSWGIIYGTSLCSATNADYATIGTPNEIQGSGSVCWCKATGYTPNGSTIKYAQSSTPNWVVVQVSASIAECLDDCPGRCAIHLINRNQIRQPLFGISGS